MMAINTDLSFSRYILPSLILRRIDIRVSPGSIDSIDYSLELTEGTWPQQGWKGGGRQQRELSCTQGHILGHVSWEEL